jgi:hypothetical protein
VVREVLARLIYDIRLRLGIWIWPARIDPEICLMAGGHWFKLGTCRRCGMQEAVR